MLSAQIGAVHTLYPIGGGNAKVTNCLIEFYLAARFLFLLTTVVTISAPPLTKRSAIHNAMWLLSPV